MRSIRTARRSLPPDRKSSPRRVALEAEARRRLDLRSEWISRAFFKIFEASVHRHFHAVRVSRAVAPPARDRAPLVLFSNHPSWWDACIHVIVAAHLFSGRIMRGPIDAAMIEKYPFMPKIGIFGVEQGDARGAAVFLAVCREVLRRPREFLAITAQGHFADQRSRPIVLEPGLAHLADLAEDTAFVPLAIDYTFWTERRGEVLLRFGPPIAAAELKSLDVAHRNARLAEALEATMDALAVEVVARDPGAFDLLVSGRRGVHPVFDAWRRLRAAVGGRRFDPGHAP